MDVSDPAHPVLSQFLTSKGRAAGPWGRGGPVRGPKGVYVQTADGPRDPAAGAFGAKSAATDDSKTAIVRVSVPGFIKAKLQQRRR